MISAGSILSLAAIGLLVTGLRGAKFANEKIAIVSSSLD